MRVVHIEMKLAGMLPTHAFEFVHVNYARRQTIPRNMLLGIRACSFHRTESGIGKAVSVRAAQPLQESLLAFRPMAQNRLLGSIPKGLARLILLSRIIAGRF
jgi:hypothetical protein